VIKNCVFFGDKINFSFYKICTKKSASAQKKSASAQKKKCIRTKKSASSFLKHNTEDIFIPDAKKKCIRCILKKSYPDLCFNIFLKKNKKKFSKNQFLY
jgi:hypothetical protein